MHGYRCDGKDYRGNIETVKVLGLEYQPLKHGLETEKIELKKHIDVNHCYCSRR